MRTLSLIAVVMLSGLTTGAQTPQPTCNESRQRYKSAVFDQVKNASLMQQMLQEDVPWDANLGGDVQSCEGRGEGD